MEIIEENIKCNGLHFVQSYKYANAKQTADYRKFCKAK